MAIEHINEFDTLNAGREKINKHAIDPANRAEINAIDAKSVANQAKQTSQNAEAIAINTDDRLDNIIAGEIQDAEVIDARRPFGSEAYATLGERLDKSDAQLAQKAKEKDLLERAVNVKEFGASGSNQYTNGSITAGSNKITVDSTIDFEVGQGVLVAGAGDIKKEVLTLVIEKDPSKSGTISVTLPGETAKTVPIYAEKEVVTIKVTSGATTTGYIYLVIDGVDFEIPVTAGETPIQIADRIRGWFIEGWTVYKESGWSNGGTPGTDTVILTAAEPLVRKDTLFFSGGTGVAVTLNMTKGSLSTPQDIAYSVRQLTFTNWIIGGYANSNVVFFIAKTNGAKTGQTAVYSDGGTGATGRLEVVQFGNYLVGKITNISGNTLTIDKNAINTVSNGYVGHDDTDAFISGLAVASGSKFFIPKGIYLLSKGLTPDADTIITGAGSESSVLQYQAVGIHGIALWKGKDNNVIEKIQVKNVCAPDAYFEGVPVGSPESELAGIKINEAKNTVIQDCLIDNADDAGIADNYSSYTRILNNTILNTAEGSGIELLRQEKVLVLGNRIRYSAQHGVRLCGAIKPTIQSNFLEFNDAGISVQGMSNGSNVLIQRSEGFLISHNHILHGKNGVNFFNQVNTGRVEHNHIETKFYRNPSLGIEFRFVKYGERINRVFDIIFRNNTVKGYNKAISIEGDARRIFIKNNELFIWENAKASSAYGIYLSPANSGGDLLGIFIEQNTFISNCENKLGVRLFSPAAKTLVHVHDNTFNMRNDTGNLSDSSVFNVGSGTYPNALVKTKGGSIDTNIYVTMER